MTSLRAQLKAAREELKKSKKEMEEKDKVIGKADQALEDAVNEHQSLMYVEQINQRLVEERLTKAVAEVEALQKNVEEERK